MIDFACKRFELEEIIKCSLGLTKAEFRLMKHLLELKDWVTTEDLAKKLKLDLSTIQRSIKKLSEKNIVHRRQTNLNKGGYYFVYKIAEKQDIQDKILEIIENWTKTTKEQIKKWN